MATIFQGQVKTCRGGKSSQWKSGYVGVNRLEDGALCAKMYLNVMPSQVYSEINHMLPSGLSVKSNRVVFEDAKGPGMYVRLSGTKDVEESRRAISQLAVVETPKKNKAEVGAQSTLSSSISVPNTLKKSPPSSGVKHQSANSVSWTKITTPKMVSKTREYNVCSMNGRHLTPGHKRRSVEMDGGDIDKLYNDENQRSTDFEKAGDYTGIRKPSHASDVDAIRGMRTNSFYGNNALLSPGLHIKSPVGRVRDQASSAKKGLYSSMTAIQEYPDNTAPAVENGTGPGVVPAGGTGGRVEVEENSSGSSIVGFDNLGNTCFINSPLQCLAYLEPLSLDIQEVVYKYNKVLKPISVIRLLYLLMKDVRKSSGNRNPDRVKRILTKLRQVMDGKFEANTQQDAHELLSEILDRCHEEVQDLMKLEEEKNEEPRFTIPKSPSPSRYILSPTESNFSWYFKNSFQLQSCKHQSMAQEEHDTTMMLALTSQPELHLQDCLDNYFKGCEVEMKCEHCNQPEKAVITRNIVRRPRCLILNLLRYCTDNQDTKKKMDRVTIPRYISIADFCMDDAKPPMYTLPTFLNERFMTESDSTDRQSPTDKNNSASSPHSSTNGHLKREDDCATESTESCFKSKAYDDDNPENSCGKSEQTSMDDDSVFVSNNGYSTEDKVAPVLTLSVDVACGESDQICISDDDDGAVSFPKMMQPRVKSLRCRGGSVKNCSLNDGLVKDGSDKGLHVVHGDVLKIYGESVSQGHCVEYGDDFIPVGEIQRKGGGNGRLEDEDNESNSGEVSSKEVEISGIVEEACDAEPSDLITCLTYKTEFDVKNNSVTDLEMSSGAISQTDSKDATYTTDDDPLMDLGDIATELLCGKNFQEYTEAELQALDIAGLTEYEMILYAQALSSLEYEKENEARERMQSHGQSIENVSEDYIYDESFMEEAESLLSVDKTASSSMIISDVMLEVSASPMKQDGVGHSLTEGESTSTELSDKGENREVPDILGGVNNVNLGLFCEENLSEDDIEKGKSKTTSNAISRLDSFSRPAAVSSTKSEDLCLFCGKVLIGCQCVHCSMGEGDFDFVPSDSFSGKRSAKKLSVVDKDEEEKDQSISPGVLSDKNFRTDSTVTKSDVKDTNNGLLKEESVKLLTINTDTSVAERIGKKSSPTVHSQYFSKPSTDLCFIPSPKNKNLVKTRDYSRLRSPSASPKKKHSKPSPIKKGSASKQLRFSDDISNSNNGTVSFDFQIPHNTPEKSLSSLVPFQNSTPEVGQNKLEDAFDKHGMKASSRALFGDDEVDSMVHSHTSSNNNSHCRDGNTKTVSCFTSSSPFQAVNTSTPIISNTTSSTCRTSTTSIDSTTAINITTAITNSLCGRLDKAMTTATAYEDISSEGDDGSENNSGGSKDGSRKGACAPVQDGSNLQFVNRSLSNSFPTADGKENSLQANQERQARRKRISHIETGEADCSYRLVGIVNHHGESLFAGHYTCSSYNLYKQRWYHMDDKHTRETTEAAVRKDSSMTGYVYFYMDKELYDSYASVRNGAARTRNCYST